jgi:outer membrane protein assembly factor BamB
MRRLVVLLAALVLVALGASAAHAGSTWPTVSLNPQRTGNDTSGPGMLPVHNAWNASLDATVYAQPLVFDGRVYSATENDSVYALDAHDGKVLWKRHLGTPMTNVGGQVGCGNVDPLGILSTPVIDTARHIIFVVATIQDQPPGHIHHQLFGLDTTTGIPVVSVNADPFPNPLYNQQRTGLLLANGRVYIGYGGYAGDCGPYHGWLVSLSESGTGKVAFNVTPHGGLGAIWAPGGVSADSAGNVYAATGNPDPDGSGDLGESLLKFDNSSAMHLVKAFKTFPGGDDDLSSVSPAQLPNHMVFQVGKHRVGYLVDTTTMTALHTLGMCNGDADGADAWDGSHLYVPCNDGIQQVNVDVGNRNMGLGWRHGANSSAGSPMLAAGSLWYVDWGSSELVALDPATGATRNGFPISLPSSVPHFAAPSFALGLILVGTDDGVSAYAGPSGVPPHAPDACRLQTNHTGYWIASTDGNVFPLGGAPVCGSLVGTHLHQPIVGIAGLSTNGYWLVSRDGGIFSFGTARYHGGMGGKHLARPIIAIARTPSGNGYWLVASDGGIFGFGDAKFHGSTGNIRLARPIVGMAATPSGKGYWLVASDGGIFSYGDAKFHGGMGGKHLNRPIVGMAATPSGKGYWLVASDGGIFSFGDAKFHGSTGNIRLASPIVGMTRSTVGYWFVAADGGVFAFDAPFHGSAAGLAIGTPVVGMAHD